MDAHDPFSLASFLHFVAFIALPLIFCAACIFTLINPPMEREQTPFGTRYRFVPPLWACLGIPGAFAFMILGFAIC